MTPITRGTSWFQLSIQRVYKQCRTLIYASCNLKSYLSRDNLSSRTIEVDAVAFSIVANEYNPVVCVHHRRHERAHPVLLVPDSIEQHQVAPFTQFPASHEVVRKH